MSDCLLSAFGSRLSAFGSRLSAGRFILIRNAKQLGNRRNGNLSRNPIRNSESDSDSDSESESDSVSESVADSTNFQHCIYDPPPLFSLCATSALKKN